MKDRIIETIQKDFAMIKDLEGKHQRKELGLLERRIKSTLKLITDEASTKLLELVIIEIQEIKK